MNAPLSAPSLLDAAGVDRERAQSILGEALAGADDGELFLEYSQTEALMFDNGRERTGSGQYSRGVELSLDLNSRRASLAWQFVPDPVNFAPYLGHVERLANGNTQVHFGLGAGPFNDLIATGPLVSYEITPSGTQAFRAQVTGASSVYRSWPFPTVDGEVRVH